MARTLDDCIVDVEDDPDRRETYRMSSSEVGPEAKLKVGSKIVKVAIVDESAGGYLVEAKEIPTIRPNNHVELFSRGGAFLLRVAWRRNVEGRVRLGLQRICQSPAHQGSPWVVWMAAALVIGIGVGLIASSGGDLATEARFFGHR